MKVGFLCQPWDHSGPPDPGGSIGIWTWEVARRLAHTHEVAVIGLRHWRGPAVEEWEGVRFWRMAHIDWRGAIRRRLSRFGRLAPSTRPTDSFAASYKAGYAHNGAHIFRNLGVEVVHIHQFSQWAPIVRSVYPRARIVLHMHSDWLVQLDRKLIERRLSNVETIIGVSDYVTNNIRRAFPQYADRCVTVFNGVDTASITPRKAQRSERRHPRVVFISRVSPEKGVHVLLEAFARVVRECPDARLEIIGGEYLPPPDFIIGLSKEPMVRDLMRFYDGSYLAALRSQARDWPEDRVNFLGHIPRSELIDRLSGADVFVQPSLASEMFGMAVAEAMAAGIPVVATRICGLPEVVADGETGLLAPPDDPAALAQAIIRLLKDAPLAQRMGSAGRRRAERLFSWDHTAAALERVYGGLHGQSNATDYAAYGR